MNARPNSSMEKLAVGLRFSYVLYIPGLGLPTGTCTGIPTRYFVRGKKPRITIVLTCRLTIPSAFFSRLPRAAPAWQPWQCVCVCNKIHGTFRTGCPGSAQNLSGVRSESTLRRAICRHLRDIPLTFPRATKIILKCPRWPDVIAGGIQLTRHGSRRELARAPYSPPLYFTVIKDPTGRGEERPLIQL